MARILLIDDEEALLRLLGVVLHRHGHVVVASATAREGLNLLRADSTIGAAVLDMSLPDMSGAAALDEIFSIAPHLPVLVASGSPVCREDLRLDPGRKVGFLQKPFPPRALLEALDELMPS